MASEECVQESIWLGDESGSEMPDSEDDAEFEHPRTEGDNDNGGQVWYSGTVGKGGGCAATTAEGWQKRLFLRI